MLKLSGKGQSKLKLSGNGNECKPLVTGLYALFLLYRTQRAVPAVRIYVTPQQVDLMAALARELKAMGAADGVHVLREMYDDGAFVVGAVEVDTREELAAQTTKLRGHAGVRGGVDGAGDAGARVGAARGGAGTSKRRDRDDNEDGEEDGRSEDDDMDHDGDGEDGRGASHSAPVLIE